MKSYHVMTCAPVTLWVIGILPDRGHACPTCSVGNFVCHAASWKHRVSPSSWMGRERAWIIDFFFIDKFINVMQQDN